MDSWIAEALTDPDKEPRKCSMISLVHMVGQIQKEIHSTSFKGGRSWTAEQLATMFNGKAQTYCQDIPGVQSFQLLAFYGESTTAEAFFPFMVNVSTEFNGLATEAPTDTGQKQQTMRHNEMLLQQVYRRQQTLDEFSTRLISMQAGIIQNLTQENRDAFTIVKEMLMERALSDHKHKMDQLQFERETTERKKWLSFAPPLLNTLLGRELFPQGTADTALVESIADSLTQEDIMKLASSLKPELWGPLAARMHAYMEKKSKEDEQLKQISQYASSDPESDAAGDIVRTNGRLTS